MYKKSKVTGGSTANENDATRLEVPNIANLSSCVEACCAEIKCHVSLMYDGKCYMISCLQDSFCLPTSDPSGAHDSSLVLVRTPSGIVFPRILFDFFPFNLSDLNQTFGLF